MKKNILITGVSGGIGSCLAEQFLEQGATIIGLDIVPHSCSAIDFYCCDTRDAGCVSGVFDEITEKYGFLDALVNVAGIIGKNSIYRVEDLPYDEWKEVLRVNLDGTFLVTQKAIPLLKKSDIGGNIVSISSEQVIRPTEGSAPYAISKAGVEMLTKILAVELLDSKIRVNAIAAASVKTDFIRRIVNDSARLERMFEQRDAEMPFGIIDVKDVFQAVSFLLSDGNKMTGQIILMDSGYILKRHSKKE